MLSSDRLELRPFRPEDTEELHSLFTDAAVRRWLLDDAVVPRSWVEAEIAASVARFRDGSAGLWAVREPPDVALLGFAGFRPFFEPPELQLLYGLLPAAWGRGLATEAARTAVDYAFDVLGLEEVRAATDVPNVDSIAVLRRLGFDDVGRTDEGAAGTVRFRLKR